MNDNRPVCCGKPMSVNAHYGTATGAKINYRCRKCGKSVSIKEEAVK